MTMRSGTYVLLRSIRASGRRSGPDCQLYMHYEDPFRAPSSIRPRRFAIDLVADGHSRSIQAPAYRSAEVAEPARTPPKLAHTGDSQSNSTSQERHARPASQAEG